MSQVCKGGMMACVCLASAVLGIAQEPARAPNRVVNPGFEELTPDGPKAWEPYGHGADVDEQIRRNGLGSIRCRIGGPDDVAGLVQHIRFEKPYTGPISASGWSRAEGVSVEGGGNYSVFLDCTYPDGEPGWLGYADFPGGSHDWVYRAGYFYADEPISEILLYALLRRGHGTAWFDDVRVALTNVQVLPVSVTADFPRSQAGMILAFDCPVEAQWHIEISDREGVQVAQHESTGRRAQWHSDGRDKRGEALPAGEYSVDVTARAPEGATYDAVSLALDTRRGRRTKGIAEPMVWVEDSITHVFPNSLPPAQPTPVAQIQLAGNEYEPFQIVISAPDDGSLSEVLVGVSDLLCAETGARISADNLQCQRVGFVTEPFGHATHPLADPENVWWPDPLLSAEPPFDVSAAVTQPVWVTLYAPPGTQAGTYVGHLEVFAGNEHLQTIELRARVFGFSLPGRNHLKNALSLNDDQLRKVYGQVSPELRQAYLDFLAAHRLNFTDIYRTDPPQPHEVAYTAERGLDAFNVCNVAVPRPPATSVWRTSSQDYPEDFADAFIQRMDPVVRELRERGLSELAYFYGFDEQDDDVYPIMTELFGRLKERYPEIPTFSTLHLPARTDFAQYNVDWYCPIMQHYDPEYAKVMRKKGKQVWWYVCCSPQYPYPNFASVEYPPIEARLIWWMNYLFEIDGFLYWNINSWYAPNASVIKDAAFLDWQLTMAGGMAGDGNLIYPGPDGPQSSIRLENLRDGIEDYEYLWLLGEKLGKERALRECRSLVRSRTEFTRDGMKLLQRREAIGRVLEP